MNRTINPQPTLAFIGAGNMGGAILRGLIRQGYPVSSILATGRDLQRLQELATTTGIRVTDNNIEAIEQADVVILGVKPQMMKAVCEPLVEVVQRRQPLLISIAAGLQVESLESWLGGNLPLVRSMPNTPSLVGAGIAGLYANKRVTAEQKGWVETISQAVGQAVWVDTEQQLDAVTAISGSGPAYYFLFTEALAQAGEQLGLTPELALQLARQTAAGAGRMLETADDSPAELRRKVTSPGGTTEQAILSFEQNDLRGLATKATAAAAARAAELAEILKG